MQSLCFSQTLLPRKSSLASVQLLWHTLYTAHLYNIFTRGTQHLFYALMVRGYWMEPGVLVFIVAIIAFLAFRGFLVLERRRQKTGKNQLS